MLASLLEGDKPGVKCLAQGHTGDSSWLVSTGTPLDRLESFH